MIPTIVAVVVLVLDQASKAWILSIWPEPYTGEIEIIPRWLELIYIRNTGVAFGLFSGVPQLFTITSLAIVAGAIWFYLTHLPRAHAGLALSLGMIVGGALGNVIDRVRFGYVVDFIKTFDGRFAIFNVADSCVVVGVTLMALLLVREENGQQQRIAPAVEGDDGR